MSFGYRIIRRFENGVVSTGEREIAPQEADIIPADDRRDAFDKPLDGLLSR